jgi:hypothetical protein
MNEELLRIWMTFRKALPELLDPENTIDSDLRLIAIAAHFMDNFMQTEAQPNETIH